MGDNIYGYYKSIFNLCDVFGQQSNRIRWKMQKVLLHCSKMAIMPFKVIEVGTNRKPVCDFLLVINSNWQPISYRCRVIAVYCSNFSVLWHCWLGHLTRKNPVPDMTYNVFGGTLSLTQSIMFKFWRLCVFEPPFGGLGTMYDVHVGLIGKSILLLVITELFSLDVTAEALTGENRSKIGDFALTRSVWPEISGIEGDGPTNNFCTDS